jgi:hypothetical protein
MTSSLLRRHLLPGLLAGALYLSPAQGQHFHVNAGAVAPEVGAALTFVNRALFAEESRFVIHLRPVESALYGPLFYGGADLTFTALPATLDNGGPSPKAALSGTRIAAIVESVDGPPGGAFSFWDSFDGFFDATEITFTVPIGTLGGTNRFLLSENDGSPGADPYGHIHGRKFSATLPGTYRVGLRLVDDTLNGPGNGPLHAPSERIVFLFQAGLTLAVRSIQEGTATVQFGTESNRTYRIESTSALGPTAIWQQVGEPVTGTGRLETVTGLPAAYPETFFRLRVD